MADQTATSKAVNTSWPVRMAQFVPPPSAEALAKALPFFKKKRGSSLPGTWLSSNNTATVTVSSGSDHGPAPSIALILQGHVHIGETACVEQSILFSTAVKRSGESVKMSRADRLSVYVLLQHCKGVGRARSREEHLLSALAFTWPRFRDENGESSAPGRVIFASYKKNDTNNKHKFAMQFETVLQAEWFFHTIKQFLARDGGDNSENSHNIEGTDAVPQVDIFEISLGSKSAFVSHDASMGALHHATRNKSLTMLTDIPPLSELSMNGDVPAELRSGTDFNTQNPSLVLPPRFPPPELQHHAFKERTDNCRQKGKNPTTNAEGVRNEQILKEKIMACFLDPEFQDFVDQVERIWHAMEDDMASEISSIKL